MKQLIRSRMEVVTMVVGFGLPVLLLGLYIWAGNGLADQLKKAANATQANPGQKVEFNIKGAEAILNTRGLLQ